jgi:DNA polymerase delta subunit 1
MIATRYGVVRCGAVHRPTPRPAPPGTQVLTSQSLATFTLVDCAQSLLGQTLEVLGAHHLAALSQMVREARPAAPGAAPSGPASPSGSSRAAAPGGGAAAEPQTPVRFRGRVGQQQQQQGQGTPSSAATPGRAGGSGSQAAGEAGQAIAPSWQAAAARLARYTLRRLQLVGQLLGHLATLPEAFEMARVTGLTIDQVGGLARLGGRVALLLRPGRLLQLAGLLAPGT